MLAINIGYVRVSRAEERPENQMLAIRRFIGENTQIRFFTDIGVSGAVPARKRKGFRQMLRFIFEIRQQNNDEEINLYVYEISRIGRDMFDTVTMIRKLEKDFGVRVFSVSEKEQFLNTQEESVRNLILTIFAWVAERERELTRQRIFEGMRRAKLEGKRIGRPKVELTEKQIKEVRRYLRLGLTISAISKLMGVNYYTLRDCLIKLGLYEVKKVRKVSDSGGSAEDDDIIDELMK